MPAHKSKINSYRCALMDLSTVGNTVASPYGMPIKSITVVLFSEGLYSEAAILSRKHGGTFASARLRSIESDSKTVTKKVDKIDKNEDYSKAVLGTPDNTGSRIYLEPGIYPINWGVETLILRILNVAVDTVRNLTVFYAPVYRRWHTL